MFECYNQLRNDKKGVLIKRLNKSDADSDSGASDCWMNDQPLHVRYSGNQVKQFAPFFCVCPLTTITLSAILLYCICEAAYEKLKKLQLHV